VTATALQLSCDKEDLRPALVFTEAANVRVDGLETDMSEHADAAIVLEGTRSVLLTGSRIHSPGGTFLKLRGSKNMSVSVIGNDLSAIGTLCTGDDASVVFSAANRVK
jgi:hypothetical protein